MAVFLSDTFTEASTVDLTTHTPDTGGSWANPAWNSGGMRVNSADYAEGSSSGTTGVMLNSATPGGAEYDVEADLRHDQFAGQFEGLLARARATDTVHGYQCFWSAGAGTFQLEVIVNGTGANLGSWGSISDLPNDTAYSCKFEVRDATKKVYLNGVERISSDNNDITDAGLVGIRGRSGGRTDNLVATDLTGGGGTTVTGSVSEAASVADALGSIGSFGVAVAESAVALDALSSVGSFNVNLSEVFGLSDIAAREGAQADSVSESIVFSDTYTTRATLGRSLSETVVFNDALGVGGTFGIGISESISLSDSAFAPGGSVEGSLSESIVLTDSYASSLLWTVVTPASGSWTTVAPTTTTWTPQ